MPPPPAIAPSVNVMLPGFGVLAVSMYTIIERNNLDIQRESISMDLQSGNEKLEMGFQTSRVYVDLH